MDTTIPTHIPVGISSCELATAQWCAPDAVASRAHGGPLREVVVYCVHGHEVSQQAAATLRQASWNARFLEGGFEGGELCSFDAPLSAFHLQDDPALAALARIVRAADTDRLELAPQAPGLLAFSLGLSALHATNDLAMLEAAMPVYDALFAWCRQTVAGQTEHHSWKPEAMKATQP